MKEFLKKYEIWIFLILAPIMNGIFIYGISIDVIPGRLYMHGRFFILLFLLMGMIWFTRGKEGLKDLFTPMKKWKVPLKWFFLVLTFAITIACLTLLLKGYFYEMDYVSLFSINISYLVDARFMFNLILWAFVGEVVWISYAVRKLCQIMNPIYASQVVGIVWGLWWLPLVEFNVGVIPDLPLWPLMINMMAAAGMCTIIYAHTKSGLLVWLLQIMLNTSLLVFPIAPSIGGVLTYATFSILYFIFMLCFMYFANPKQKFGNEINSVLYDSGK
ncbi:type II CAAX prenyl endopeptidase Rce1 family protein [Litoribaculum gwangyangense]|uniref:CPBP family intramembrane metalloprotease n=1 Tax=Litoribaculum gwangyangense TaxID=1130722 RepID=A0ABP9CUI0_9FLAO